MDCSWVSPFAPGFTLEAQSGGTDENRKQLCFIPKKIPLEAATTPSQSEFSEVRRLSHKGHEGEA